MNWDQLCERDLLTYGRKLLGRVGTEEMTEEQLSEHPGDRAEPGHFR